MRKITVIHRRATSGEGIIFFIGDLEFDGEEWGFLLVFGGWAEE